jgi:hypothetical protein
VEDVTVADVAEKATPKKFNHIAQSLAADCLALAPSAGAGECDATQRPSAHNRQTHTPSLSRSLALALDRSSSLLCSCATLTPPSFDRPSASLLHPSSTSIFLPPPLPPPRLTSLSPIHHPTPSRTATRDVTRTPHAPPADDVAGVESAANAVYRSVAGLYKLNAVDP